jgi:hypothetical protein
LLCSPGWPWTPVLLPQPPECWDYRHAPPRSVLKLCLVFFLVLIYSSYFLFFWSFMVFVVSYVLCMVLTTVPSFFTSSSLTHFNIDDV